MIENVVLVHGLGRTCASMTRLKRSLEKTGFNVQCWSYPSRQRRLSGHIEAFRLWLADHDFEGMVHFVGHSMGGIVIRGALAAEVPVSVGRIVMIAAPNRGAGVASRYGNWPLSRFVFGAPLEDLAENSPALAKLGVPEADIGIIAGVRRFHPFNPISYLNLLHPVEQKHDGTVELNNTHLDEAKDSVVIEAHHTFICDHPEVMTQTDFFLRQGRFQQ